MRTMLIADDLTGACDAGARFAGRGAVPVFVAPASPDSASPVAVVDTESRGLAADAAAHVVRAAAKRLGPLAGTTLFKKIDSTLRGSVGAELDALLDASGRRAALVCPAFPGQHRTVVDGILLVDGAPAHESVIGHDPEYPAATSDVGEIVRRGATRPVSLLPLSRVRGDRDDLARTLADARDRILVADAATDRDLATLAECARDARELTLAGSAGLAGAVAASHGHTGVCPPMPDGRAWLFVSGSCHPASRAQIDCLERAGVLGVRLGSGRDPDVGPLIERIKSGRSAFITTRDMTLAAPDSRTAIARRLAQLVTSVLAGARPDLVAITGGETVIELLCALGTTRVDLFGAPSVGLALGEAVVDPTTRLPLLTKAGGFGAPNLFLSLLGGTT